MPTRAKLVVGWISITGVVVLGITAWAARDWIRDEWRILKLRADDSQKVLAAVDYVERRHLTRAAPALLDLLERNFEYHWSEQSFPWKLTKVLMNLGPEAVTAFFRRGIEGRNAIEWNMLRDAVGLLDENQKALLVPLCTDALRSPEPESRRTGIDLLERLGPIAHPAYPELIATLKDPEFEVRTYAALLLGKERVNCEGLIPALIEAVQDGWAGAHFTAMDILGDLGTEAESAIPTLLKVLLIR